MAMTRRELLAVALGSTMAGALAGRFVGQKPAPCNATSSGWKAVDAWAKEPEVVTAGRFEYAIESLRIGEETHVFKPMLLMVPMIRPTKRQPIYRWVGHQRRITIWDGPNGLELETESGHSRGLVNIERRPAQ